MADRGGHPADLAVAAFADRDAQPAIGDARAHADRGDARPEVECVDPFDLGGAGGAVLQHDAVAQGVERGLARLAFDLHEIGLGQLELGIRDPRLEATVVGQQQQPLAVPIEPPRRIDAGHVDELRQRRARRRRLLVGELAEDVIGFVEEDQAGHGGALAVFHVGFDHSCRFATLCQWRRGE